MPAKSKLTPEIHAKIISFVRGGAYIETAAIAAGIGKRTLYDWLVKARDPEAPEEYRAFADDLERAQGEDEIRSVLQIEQLANAASAKRTAPCPRCRTPVTVSVPSLVQLHAVTWKLERKYPERYGNTLRIEHRTRSRVEEILEAAGKRMTDGAFRELVDALEAELGELSVDRTPALEADAGHSDDGIH
jgi:hypothetical protein